MFPAEVRRPTLVTVVSVLTVISGVLDVLLGFVWLFTVDGDKTSTAGPVIGIAYLVLGIVQVAVARGLLRGDDRSRTVMTFAIILSFVTSSFALRAGGNPRALSTFDVVVAVIVLVVLYTPSSERLRQPGRGHRPLSSSGGSRPARRRRRARAVSRAPTARSGCPQGQ